MQDGRYKPITLLQSSKTRQHSLNDLLEIFHIDGFVSDEEFAKDMRLLTSGEMSPEEHREYLRNKYHVAA